MIAEGGRFADLELREEEVDRLTVILDAPRSLTVTKVLSQSSLSPMDVDGNNQTLPLHMLVKQINECLQEMPTEMSPTSSNPYNSAQAGFDLNSKKHNFSAASTSTTGSPLTMGKRSSGPLFDDPSDPTLSPQRVTPSTSAVSSKYWNLYRATILLRPLAQPDPNPKDVVVSSCDSSTLYILQNVANATVSGCRDCTIVVGASRGLFRIVDCERCTIIVAARRIVMTNSLETTVYCYTPQPPLWIGDNRSCKFGPFNIAYYELSEQLVASKLINETTKPYSYQPNKWNSAVDIDKNFNTGGIGSPTTPNGSSRGEEEVVPFSTMTVTPLEFNVCPLPVYPSLACKREHEMLVGDENVNNVGAFGGGKAGTSSGSNGGRSGPSSIYEHILSGIPFKLNTEYENSIVARMNRVKHLREKVAQSGLTGTDLAKLDEEVIVGFKQWLVAKGEIHTVTDLFAEY